MSLVVAVQSVLAEVEGEGVEGSRSAFQTAEERASDSMMLTMARELRFCY